VNNSEIFISSIQVYEALVFGRLPITAFYQTSPTCLTPNA